MRRQKSEWRGGFSQSHLAKSRQTETSWPNVLVYIPEVACFQPKNYSNLRCVLLVFCCVNNFFNLIFKLNEKLIGFLEVPEDSAMWSLHPWKAIIDQNRVGAISSRETLVSTQYWPHHTLSITQLDSRCYLPGPGGHLDLRLLQNAMVFLLKFKSQKSSLRNKKWGEWGLLDSFLGT